ncbi:MAG: efflux RND transporter periplasmic adaptor subunit [Prevotella sp.]|jgi:HlyD family secretion protein
MKMKKISKTWYIVAVLVILAFVAWLLSGTKKKEQVDFVYETVAPANIRNSITATGTVQPVDTVAVGTQVSGIIDKIYVDYNSKVKKGQVIAVLDQKNLKSTFNSAKAALAMAKANLASSQASLNYQRANFNRYKTLYKKGLVSADDYENARLAYLQAEETVASNRENVVSAQEDVSVAQTNLGYATITSPIDGIVTSKYVAEGQTVAASFSTPELFGIAKDLTDMQVSVDVDEADIADVTVGKTATFTVDAYPDDTFTGVVKQVRLGATTTNNVVTYKVIITAPNADMKLKPGLTANVTIYTTEKKGVLAVSSKALRFTPTKETVKDKKIVDCNGKNKVWVVEGNTVKAIPVSIGFTDGTHTQILSGLKQGQKVITELKVITDQSSDETASGSTESSPFAPGPHKNNKNQKSSK